MAKDESVYTQIIKIWVDDEREMPEDYNVWEITVWDTIDLLETCYRHWISVKLSLDHDAGVLSSPYEATKVLCLNAIASRADTIASQINDTMECEQVLF